MEIDSSLKKNYRMKVGKESEFENVTKRFEFSWMLKTMQQKHYSPV